MRILALVTDAFGASGGIAEYNQRFLTSLTTCNDNAEVLVLPRIGECHSALPSHIRQFGPVPGRIAYSVAAFRAARINRPIQLVYCGHLFHVPVAVVVARYLRAPLWIQVHGVDGWQELSGFYRRCINTAALVTAVSRYTRQRFLEWTDIDPSKVKVLPNAVDPVFQSGPRPDYLVQRHRVENKKVLLTVSRLSSSEKYKGHDRVIRILSRVIARWPDLLYLVIGEGDDRQRLEALAEQLGVADNVQFVGQVSHSQLPDYYRLADVFVMPSLGEGFGIVFLEAMSSGVAVIGGNKDGSVDPLSHAASTSMVDPGNTEELLAAIEAALARPRANETSSHPFCHDSFEKHVHALLRLTLEEGATSILSKAAVN